MLCVCAPPEQLFPAFYVDMTTHSTVSANTAPGLILLACGMVYVWGAFTAALLAPPYAGLIVCTAAKVVALGFAVTRIRRTQVRGEGSDAGVCVRVF